MRTISILFVLIFSWITGYSQTEKTADPKQDLEIVEEMTPDSSNTSYPQCGEEIFIIIEEMPKYNGGEEAVYNYLRVSSSDIQGKVYIQFVIDCHGNVVNPNIIRGISPLADKMAMDLVKAMRDWTPGEQRGQKVNVLLTYPVIFQ